MALLRFAAALKIESKLALAFHHGIINAQLKQRGRALPKPGRSLAATASAHCAKRRNKLALVFIWYNENYTGRCARKAKKEKE